MIEPGSVFNVALDLKKQGFSEATVDGYCRKLWYLEKRVSLHDPEAVKRVIAELESSVAFKEALVNAYDHYVRVNGLEWTKPFYIRQRSLPYVASREQVNSIIARSSRRYAVVFSVLRDTGLRPCEIKRLTLKEIDLDSGVISARSTKDGNPRLLKLHSQTLSMLKEYLEKSGVKDKVFPSPGAMRHAFERYRNDVAAKLHDPNIRKIRLYDLRHHFATMLYHKTKDILYVKQQLGHKRLENTLIYTHLVNFSGEDYICRIARTVQDASKLIEDGFDYVCEVEGVKLFRKPK